ncbi:hypothetical protein MMC30_000873 [Trapelia coarctata]|nr:hypothetical protein [Trapelia coarctata]
MAAPGLGVGDIVNACNYIYTKCMQYKDGIKEFEEIASKAKSTNVVIQRLEDEARNRGSLVERAGSQAYEQLESNLSLLREDAKKLKELVVKYGKIQDIRGRRLLFAFRESDNLTDLRRRIGLHERTLELWYSTLVYESLRRLENGQADIFAGQEDIFAAIKAMDIPTLEAIKAELRRGREGLLTDELRKRTYSRRVTKDDVDVAKSYVTASPPERANIESQSRMRSHSSTYPNVTQNYEYGMHDSTSDYGAAGLPGKSPPSAHIRPTHIKVHRKHLDPRTLDAFGLPWDWDTVSTFAPSKSSDYLIIKQWVPVSTQDELFDHTIKLREVDKLKTRIARDAKHDEENRKAAPPRHLENDDVNRSYFAVSPPSPSPSRDRYPNIVLTHAHRPPQRRSSDATARPAPKPFLDIPIERRGRNRPASYHESHRSPRHSFEILDDAEGEDIMVIEQARRRRRESQGRKDEEGLSRSRSRHSSTHSYYRVRPGSDSGGEGEGKIRMVDRMDRIDSMDTQEGGVRR